ncbi:cytidine deaminase [bacterium]|nr:cytidine deaminase [bacterium]
MITNEELMNIAKDVVRNSYSPYSNFPVGAAVLYDNGNIYKGTNVENSSFGLTLCAERNALSTAIAEGEKGNILAIAIYSPKEKMCAPCGACRQWIWEFANNNDIQIILEAHEEGLHITSIKELLPLGFKLR